MIDPSPCDLILLKTEALMVMLLRMSTKQLDKNINMSEQVIDLCSDDSDVPSSDDKEIAHKANAEDDVEYQCTTIDISADNNNGDTDSSFDKSTISLNSTNNDVDGKVPAKRQKFNDSSNTESDTQSQNNEIKQTNTNEDHLMILKEERYIEPEEGSTLSESSSSNFSSEAQRLMDDFFDKCQKIIGAEVDEKIKIIQSKAKKASEYLTTSEFLETFQRITNVESKSKKLAKALFSVNDLLISHSNVDYHENNSHLDRLYEKLQKVQHMVDKYATEEVEFDDEGNSAFMKFEKYKERAALIVKCIRKLERKSVHSGIAYFLPLEFNSSKFPEFNEALTKKYKTRDQHKFPSLYEVDRCLRKCAKSHGFSIKESEMVAEINKCFAILGKSLKRRRQHDLGFLHFGYIEGKVDDPAENDPALEIKLRENMKTYSTRRDKIFEDYASKEAMGVEAELSSDSDDSKIDGYASSD